MTTQELVILDGLNIASTIHKTRERGFEATAVEILEVIQTDERIREEYQPQLRDLTTRQVTAHLVRLEGRGRSPHTGRAGKYRDGVPRPLVEQPRRGKWRLTDWACEVLTA